MTWLNSNRRKKLKEIEEQLKNENNKDSNNKFYPSLIKVEDLYDRWKKTTDQMFTHTYSSWKELFEIFKKSKLKYRFPLEEGKFSKVFSLRNINSNITLYSFI